jgi:hypothetical protein
MRSIGMRSSRQIILRPLEGFSKHSSNPICNYSDEIVGAAWLDLGWWEVSLELVAGEPEPIDWRTAAQAFTRWARDRIVTGAFHRKLNPNALLLSTADSDLAR